MSVKDFKKHEKSKKASDVHSQGHKGQSTQSVSSLSSHIEDLQKQQKRFRQNLELAFSSIKYHRQMMNNFMGLDDQYSKEMAKNAEEELQLWQQAYLKIMKKLKTVDDRWREILGYSERPQRKKKNYALQKVLEPPSDNE